MSFTSEYLELKKKRKKEEQGTGKNSFTEQYLQAKAERVAEEELAPVRPASSSAEDIYRSMGSTYKKKEDDEDDFWSDLASKMPNSIAAQKRKKSETSGTYFQKGALEDGFSAKNVAKAMLSTGRDLMTDIYAGMAGIVENTIDVGADIVGSVGGAFGAKDFRDDMDEFAKKDIINEQKVGEVLSDINGGFFSKVSQKIITGDTETEGASFLGEKTDALAQSGGQLVGTMLLQGVGVPWYATTGVTSFGSEYEHALQEGATHGEANLSAAVTAGAEMLTEKLFGGSGLGEKGLIDLDGLTKGISNKLVKRLLDFGLDMTAEGSEEVVSQFASNLGSALYREENLKDILFSEEAIEGYLDSFIGGFALGGVMNVGKVANSAKTGRDYRTGLTDNEQAVFDKVYENEIAEREQDGKKLTRREKSELYDEIMERLEKGYISTDDIESVLGGESYNAYKESVDAENALKDEQKALEDELKTLQDEYKDINKKQWRDMTGEEMDRRDEIKNRLPEIQSRLDEIQTKLNDQQTIAERNVLKAHLSKNVYDMVKENDRLRESYFEQVRSKQKFQADLSKYKGRARDVIKKVMDSKLADNTNQTHDFWDWVAKMAVDLDTDITLASNEQILEMVKAEHEARGKVFDESKFAGQTIDGFASKSGIAINAASKRALNFVVGHEITHKFEKSKRYDRLQKLVLEYAKDEYESRFNERAGQYKNKFAADEKFKSQVDQEVTGDLIGDYVFNDKNFIVHLTKDRNVFQWVWDEIKYMAKIATAGSEQAKQLERVKREFERIYRENVKGKNNTAENGSIRYKLSDLDIDRVNIDFLDTKAANEAVDAKVSDLVDRGKVVPLSNDSIASYEKLTDWDNKKLVRDLLEGVLKPNMGVSVLFKYGDQGATAYLTSTGINHSIGGPASPKKAAAFEKFLALVKNAEYVYSSDNHSHTDSNQKIAGDKIWDTFVAVATINGEPYPVTFKIRSIDADVRSQIYEMATKNETGFSHEGGTQENPANAHSDYGTSPISGDNLAQEVPVVKEQYSISDSDGRELSQGQQEFFKDSKMRDDDGNLKVMYHGTPNGDFTIFKDGTYFTDNKEYADRYQNPGASSISSGKVASNPKTFEVYLNITKPFDIKDAEARRIYIEDYIKGGNAMGINPYLSDAEYDRIDTIDWTEGEDLREFLIENGYDYDGLVLDEGADGGYGDEVKSRGTSYVVFSPEQVKNADNLNPTEDPDIRFSLSEAVEETHDLIALHNLHSSELLETLKLSGLPSPSVAIIKAKDGHEKYGDVSLILSKNAIDPQENKANRIYGSDAWTPTRSNAQVEYEVDYDIQRQFEKAIEALSKKVANGVFSKSSVLGMAGIEDSTDLNLNEIAKKMSDYDAVQAAYVAENGGNVEVVYRTKEFDAYGNDALKGYLDKVGEQEVARLAAKMLTGERLTAEEIETAKDALVDNWIAKKAYALRQKPELREIRIAKFRERLTNMRVEDFVRHAWEFYEDSGATTDEINIAATGDNLRAAVNRADVESWVAEKLQGLLSEPGIYNGKEIYYPSGKRRSFKETHWDYTAENIVRAMNNADARGANVWNVSGEAIIATATSEYKSIDEVRADKGRLFNAEQGDYEQIKDNISAELESVTKDIIRTTEHISDNQYDEEQIIGRVIMEAAQGTKTVAGIKRVFQKNGYRIGDAQAKSVLSLFNHASSVPTGYFEAKPQRVVGFDEVGVYVIPNNADTKLKQELLNRGYNIAEYDPNVEGDRQRVVNGFEDLMFSLSDDGQQFRDTGGYKYYSNHAFLNNDIAPVAETPSASVSEMESVAPVVVSEKETPTEAPVYQDEPIPEATQEDTQALFPDDLAPAQAELEQLEAERAEIYSGLETALEHGSANEVEQLAAEYDSITARIRALEAEDSQRANSLDDADVPPEMEAPYYGESDPAIPENPFADRDEKAVGSQKVKAYQYENPEVKPFFYDAALGMMYDVDNSTHGEKIYNDQLYYESGGEQGWMGTKRHTTTDIAAFKDSYGYTWDQIREAVNDIIEDHGRENNAISKRIEFMLNDRLLYGYTDVDGRQIPPNQEYIDFLREKQINEYSKEAFDRYMATADQYAPVAEDIAPVQTAPVVETPAEVAPVAEQYEAIRPKREPQPRMVRADKAESKPRDKQRKWVGTSTESEVVDRQVLPEDLDQELIHYQPIPNRKTLGNANAKLNSLGYEKSVSYLEAKFADNKVTLDDIALGERLIQEAIKKGDTKTAGDLIMDISILGTELGQKVQALSIIKRLTPEGQLRMLQRTVERGKTKKDKAYDDVVVTQEMKDKILSAYNKDGSYDQAYLNEMVEDVKQEIADQMKVTAMDKVNAWRYLSMLGNPKTHIRNLVSNVAMRGTVAVKNAVARTIESVAPIGNRTKTWKAATDEVKAFAQKKAVEMKDALMDGGKYDEDTSIKQKRATFKNKILNGVYEFNSDMLSKEDWWFSKPAFVNSLSEYLTANGIRTEQDIKKHPEITAKAIQYATEQSQIATFRQYSWLANYINSLERKNALTNFAVGSILPFKKTPINIAKTGLNYSPLGFAKTLTYDINQVKNGKMEASELVDHLAQNLTGTALTLVGYMLASSGFLNGAGDDDKEGKYDYQLGKQAYSVNIGGATFSLSWLSPVAMPLFVGANAYEQLVEGKEWNGDVVVETLAQTLDPLSEMSFISSLDSVLSSYDSGIQKFGGFVETMLQNYSTQFVPTLSSQIATVLDDTKRTTKVAGNSKFKFIDETINNLKYKIPFLRETLEPSTDIWGNEVKQTENVLTRAFETFLAPYAKRDDIASAVDEEIKDLYSQTGDGGVIPSVPYNYVNYDGTKYEMSAKEFTRYKETYGQKAYDLLEELFDTDMYQNADSETRADLVNDVYDYAREEAKRFFFERRGIAYTNATEEGEEYYKTNPIKGAIDNNMTPDEYSFSTKYPEKYEFFKANGISYDSYAAADEDGKRAYSWAYENPGKYTMSKAISDDYMTYYGYKQEIADIKENHVGKGEKDVVTDHIFNNMDLDYGQKVILYRSMYDSKADIATYNGDILDYLNSREDISYEDTVTILRELGFEVDSEGNVRW